MTDKDDASAEGDWLVCVACGEEVLSDDARTCDGGEDFCPECWAVRARVEH